MSVFGRGVRVRRSLLMIVPRNKRRDYNFFVHVSMSRSCQYWFRVSIKQLVGVSAR